MYDFCTIWCLGPSEGPWAWPHPWLACIEVGPTKGVATSESCWQFLAKLPSSLTQLGDPYSGKKVMWCPSQKTQQKTEAGWHILLASCNHNKWPNEYMTCWWGPLNRSGSCGSSIYQKSAWMVIVSHPIYDGDCVLLNFFLILEPCSSITVGPVKVKPTNTLHIHFWNGDPCASKGSNIKEHMHI